MNDRYINYHALRLFYSNRDAFGDFCCAHGHPIKMDDYEYQDICWYTDADIYVPVWASACKGGDVLCNEITYDVIKTYKKHGYDPIGIDGNPADYAGEQLRFLEYICACALRGECPRAEDIIADFTTRYLIDTLRPTAEAIRDNGFASLCFVADIIEGIVRGDFIDWQTDGEEITSFDSYAWPLRGEIEVEKPHRVSIASFCDCGSKCKLLATVAEGCVLGIDPDTDGTPLRFTGCPRGLGYRYTFLSSKRLRYPMKRRAARGEGKFVRISWDEVTTTSAETIMRCGRDHGPESRYVMTAAGVSASIRGDRFMKNLIALDGGYLDYYNYYSAACAAYVLPYVYGAVNCSNYATTYVNSKLIILWGNNPSEGHFGFGFKETLSKAKESGAKIIAIDPRMSESVLSLADEWIPIRPSSDAALADAMCYVIFDKTLQDQEFTDKYCLGFDEDHMPQGVPYGESYKSYLFGVRDGICRTPEWAEKITGIPADTIERLAIEYATCKPAALIPGLGLQRTANGEQVCKCHAALACLTGSLGISGGSTGTYQSWQNGLGAPNMELTANPYPGSIPTFLWSRAVDRPWTIETERLGLKGVDRLNSEIKVIFNLGSSILLNQHSNINETVRILKDESKLELLVVSEVLMTPAARLTDILLPAASFMEVDNIVEAWSGDIYMLYNHKCIEPLFACRFEYDWIRETAGKMGYLDEFDDGKYSKEDWLKYLYDVFRRSEPDIPEFEEFKEKSIYIRRENNWLAFTDQLEKGKPFDTPSGKIEIFSKTLYDMGRPDDIPAIPGYINVPEGPEDEHLNEGMLQLISYHTKKRCHSQHDRNALLRELDPKGLWINPLDAQDRGIGDGDEVEIYNERGSVIIPAIVTERMMRGVIAMSEGAWFEPDGNGSDTAGSINVLTQTEQPTPLANGNPQQTNLARVRKVRPDRAS